MTQCPATGKFMYPSKSLAVAAMHKVIRHRPDGRKRHAYKCSRCGAFHFGEDMKSHRRKVHK